ncbi:endolytic transglycosylase MltG [Gordonia sp. CPCC 205333]|uniref:endolytic transglycosylase MltG n=1 Tax=Gordonia sp. CPCC 205333 TaxID=3140790 RepID=UPI003AF36D6D
MNSDSESDRPHSRHRGSADDADRRRYFTELDPASRPNTRHRRRRLDGDTSVPIWQTGQVPRVDDVVDAGTGRVLPQRIEPGQRIESAPPAPSVQPTRQQPTGEPNIRRHQPTPEELVTPPLLGDEVVAEDHVADSHRETRADDANVVDDIEPIDLAPVTHHAYSQVDDTVDTDLLGSDEPAYPFDEPDTTGRDNRDRGRRRTAVLAVVIVCLLVMVGGVGYFGLKFFGVVGANDYSNAEGTGDVLVTIPDNSTLRDFGQILTDKDVVGSVKAFTRAADGKMLSAGIYKMRTEIPASKAVAMIADGGMTYRVGRVLIPEGMQLDSKKGIDGKITPGVFQLISDATSTTVNGSAVGVTVDQLSKAASDSTLEQLGIPQWARTEVTALNGDHRRIEGLIAPGTWESIDPSASAVDILHDLITDSAARYEGWGLLTSNNSGLSPYETLIAASVVEREVSKADDFAKVARVILNRLADGQRLEMDSTANYTAEVTNIDVHGDAYSADNKWNTYREKGLPPTPIATVGVKALQALEHPATGKWKYFITVDKKGTTLFADDFDEHKKNREKACANQLLSVGCG